MVDVDANFLIDVFKRNSATSRAVARWVADGESLAISAVAWAEFLCGPAAPENAAEARGLLNSIEPLTEEDAAVAAELFNATGRRSRSLADCMIAAHAIRRDAVLATLNVRDFRVFEKFKLKLA